MILTSPSDEFLLNVSEQRLERDWLSMVHGWLFIWKLYLQKIFMNSLNGIACNGPAVQFYHSTHPCTICSVCLLLRWPPTKWEGIVHRSPPFQIKKKSATDNRSQAPCSIAVAQQLCHHLTSDFAKALRTTIAVTSAQISFIRLSVTIITLAGWLARSEHRASNGVDDWRCRLRPSRNIFCIKFSFFFLFDFCWIERFTYESARIDNTVTIENGDYYQARPCTNFIWNQLINHMVHRFFSFFFWRKTINDVYICLSVVLLNFFFLSSGLLHSSSARLHRMSSHFFPFNI